MNKAVEIVINKTTAKPVAVFGSEMWAVAAMDMNRLGTGEREILRRVHGPGVQQGMRRIRNDQELRELHKDG